MTLAIRKLVVVATIAAILLVANAVAIAMWMSNTGIVDLAGKLRTEFLTGTAITILVALMILLVNPRRAGRAERVTLSCPVCGENGARSANYCAACGSKL